MMSVAGQTVDIPIDAMSLPMQVEQIVISGRQECAYAPCGYIVFENRPPRNATGKRAQRRMSKPWAGRK